MKAEGGSQDEGEMLKAEDKRRETRDSRQETAEGREQKARMLDLFVNLVWSRVWHTALHIKVKGKRKKAKGSGTDARHRVWSREKENPWSNCFSKSCWRTGGKDG